MPANRRPVDREAKRDEIVQAAATLFTEVGFDATSMSRLASAAGVTTNTVYWYFEDKDAVLVAVLDTLLADALEEYAEQAGRPWHQQVLWAVSRLERLQRLVSVVHMRAAASPAVAAWHDGFHSLTDSLIVDALRQAGVAETDVHAVSRISTFVVEGLLSHPHDDGLRADVLRLLAALGDPD